MKVIWKYEIPVRSAPTKIEMPIGAVINTAADCPGDGPSVFVWAIVDPEAPRITRQFYVVGTGHDIPPDADYTATAIWRLATVTTGRGAYTISSPLVWHVFEVTS